MKSSKRKALIIACTSTALVIATTAIIFSLSNRKHDITADTSSDVSENNTEAATKEQDKEIYTHIPEEDNTEAAAKEIYTYTPEEIEPVWTFSISDDFPSWANPMPFINPMGNENNYSDIQTEKRSYYLYEYADIQNTRVRYYAYGDTWTLTVPFDDDKTPEENCQFIYDIEKYIESKNGIVMGYFDDSIVFILTDSGGTHWWAEAVIDYKEIILNIVRQDELKTGQTLVINTEDYEDNSIRFSSYNPGNEYQSIYLEYDKGEVSFVINTENSYGSYIRRYTTRDTLYDKYSTSFYYDSVMYDPGFSNWEVEWRDPADTKEIKITLIKTGEIPQIKFGEPLGAIKVSSEHVSNIEAFPVGSENLRINHPEFSYEDSHLDQTPDGDYIMFVPAGLWDVKLYPRGDSLVTNYETLMVPVNSGEMTTVEVPFGISNALRSGSVDYNDRGIRIGMVSEDESKNQVAFSFTLLDKSTKDILPGLENTTVTEGGVPVKLINVERAKTPPSVVLLLDSSGSMKGQMQATLDAAKSFINGLPDNAKINIVDFDSVINKLEGSTKEDAVKNLSLIKVGGDTALYNAIGVGLVLLSQEERPTLVVFTDGENDLKHIETLTLEETLELAGESDIPIFTIGFGKGHDSSALERLAEVSDGQYFRADDDEALNKVFSAINERLGSTFEAIYERPLEASIGDIPVVSFVIDTSGSMIQDYSEKYGSRIHNVKNLLRQFILDLPDEIQMQLTEFSEEVRIVQALTTDKMKILRGLGRLEARGGTDITGSVLASYKTLKEIPSTKKVLVYITDAALDTTSPDNKFFLDLLSEIKKDEINILWVGLGMEDETEDFKLAAEITGGEYIVSEDIRLLTESFNNVLKEVQNAPKSGLSNIFIGIEKINESGARESYSTGKLADLSEIKKSDDVIASETIKYTPGIILSQYDAYSADYISGFGVPAQDTIITNRMQVGREASSEAIRITTDRIFFMDRLNNVDAPSNYRFMAVTMQLKNILEAQEATIYPDGSSHPSSWLSGGVKGETKLMEISYIIPDFTSHFSLSYNNEGAYPGSLITWLTEKSLAVPGDTSITVMPDEILPGTLVFLVPDTPMEQASLHFYDINYGHIDIPLVGEINKPEYDIKSLPKQEPAKLTDTFALEITGYDEITKIPGTGKDTTSGGSDEKGGNTSEKERGIVPNTSAVFKVAEGNFISQMQALLNIDPLERFSLKINTASGDFYIPVNPATNLLPSGFSYPRMICPGSFNKVRWLFEVPVGLKNNSAEIFTDLRGEDKCATAVSGDILPGNLNARFESEFFDLTVNDLVKIEDGINGYSGNYIIADITIHDKKDGFSSAGISEMFSVVSDDFFKAAEENAGENTEETSGLNLDDESGHKSLGGFAPGTPGGGSTSDRLVPDRLTQELILGYTDDSVVFDGTSRRGIIVFRDRDNDKDKSWYLFSYAFKELKLKVNSGAYNESLLGEKIDFDTDSSFTQELNTAISIAVEKYRLNHPEKAEQLSGGNIPFGEPETDKQEIPVPTISLYGSRLISSINSVEDMVAAMKRLRFIPSTGRCDPFEHCFSKEALMTQGFGMEQDYANMAVEVLSRLGYRPKLRIVGLTELGKKELAKMSGIGEIAIDDLPAVSYVDDSNNNHILVIPFMEELAVLKRLVYMDYEQDIKRIPDKIRLEINVIGYLTEKGAREQMSYIAGALGGGAEGEPSLISEHLYSEYINLDTLSLDAIDIGIARDGNRARIFIKKADGEIFGEDYIELDKFDVKQIQLRFDLPHRFNIIHTVKLDEGMGIDDIFLTVSINAPDLPEEASLVLQEAAADVHGKAETPSELSALRWYGRSIISKFISSQTLHDRLFIDKLGLIAGRVQKPRVIVVTQKAGEKLQTSISLIETNNEIHAGKEDDIKKFNIISGIYAATLEAIVLPGEASGLEEIWANAPEGTGLVLLDYIGDDTRSDLENAGMPEYMIEYLIDTSNMVLIPDKPSLIDGQKRWAWLEIDPDTYEIYSVIDTLEKGAFVENTIMDIVKSAAQYVVGAFKGVETSIWSVAAFSLRNDDYEEILKSAKALALGLAERFGFNYGPIEGGVGSKVSVSQAVGPVKFSFDGSAGMSQNVLGFTEGYKAGVEYYFSIAE